MGDVLRGVSLITSSATFEIVIPPMEVLGALTLVARALETFHEDTSGIPVHSLGIALRKQTSGEQLLVEAGNRCCC